LIAQTALIESAAENGWRAQKIPDWTSATGTTIATAVGAKMIGDGLDLQKLDTDNRVSCEWTTRLLTAIADKPTSTAAGLYRWILAGAH
jgi:hypothetical protein